MNDWNGIKDHYARLMPRIMAQEQCEWAVDAYAWSGGMMTMTPIESDLWAYIRECNAIFYPQFPVGRVFVDFANPKARVAIECDGRAFHDAAKDSLRDQRLAEMGWTVYRISGADCKKDDDPETGKRGVAHQFVYDIVEQHRIARHHRERRDSGWVSVQDVMACYLAELGA